MSLQNTKIIRRIDFDPEFEPVSIGATGFSPVIEHEVLSGLEKSREIVARARKEAARLRKRGRDLLAQAVVEKEEERKLGFEEGVEQGQAELTGKIAQAAVAHERILREAEPEIVRMVMEIAEKVIGREMKKGAVVDVVKKALTQSVGQRIMVRIHPSDLEAVKERQGEILSLAGEGRAISVKEDEEVPAGGCIVETELGTVDARLETQLKAIRKALGLSEK